MKSLLTTLFVLMFSLASQGQNTGLIQSDVPFARTSVVTLKPDPRCEILLESAARLTQTQKRLEAATAEIEKCVKDGPHKIETGTLNGVPYQVYYSDGSGEFAGTRGNTLQPLERIEGNWLVGCDKDAITDEKTCHMDRGDVRVWVDGRGRSEIYIGSDHYPSSQVVLRIDKGEPLAINSRTFNGSFGFRFSPSIIKKISQAKLVTTRYQKWPYKDYEDDTWEPFGFNEALQYIKWAVAHIK